MLRQLEASSSLSSNSKQGDTMKEIKDTLNLLVDTQSYENEVLKDEINQLKSHVLTLNERTHQIIQEFRQFKD